MEADDLFSLDELIFQERKCRTCGKTKSLMDDFYLTRKDRGSASSAYSYECKECTIKRITGKRKENYNPVPRIKDVYPDW
jgi:hypothetical protein